MKMGDSVDEVYLGHEYKQSLSDESTDKSSSQDSESARTGLDSNSQRFNLSKYLMEQGILKNGIPVAVNNSSLYFQPLNDTQKPSTTYNPFLGCDYQPNSHHQKFRPNMANKGGFT
jgi:hypothetical protein